MKIRDIMKPAPITATEVTRLGEALQTMMKHRIRHLPVVCGERLCGILSERDILHYRAVTAFREDWWRAPVTAAMIASVQTAGPDDSLTEVAGRLPTRGSAHCRSSMAASCSGSSPWSTCSKPRFEKRWREIVSR